MQPQFLGVVNEETVEWGKNGHYAEKPAVQEIVQPGQVAVLHLVQNHETVVLADHVVVGPDRHDHGQDRLAADQHQDGSQSEEERRAAEQ